MYKSQVKHKLIHAAIQSHSSYAIINNYSTSCMYSHTCMHTCTPTAMQNLHKTSYPIPGMCIRMTVYVACTYIKHNSPLS